MVDRIAGRAACQNVCHILGGLGFQLHNAFRRIVGGVVGQQYVVQQQVGRILWQGFDTVGVKSRKGDTMLAQGRGWY